MQKLFEKKEIKEFLITVLILAVILSFNSWGIETFDFVLGLRNLVATVLVVGISMAVKLFVQKNVSKKVGMNAEFGLWKWGLILGALFIVTTNGLLAFLAVGGITYSLLHHIRVGHKYGLSYTTMGWLSSLGPLTHVILALFFKALIGVPFLSAAFMETAMKINLAIAIFSILPVPMINFKIPIGEMLKDIHANDGLMMLFAGRWSYFGALALVISSAVAMINLPLIYGILFAAAFTFFAWILYYVAVEQNI